MYLESLSLQNIGPLESVRINTRRTAPDVAPVPLVPVGEYGTGKTLALATIADSFHEFAAKASAG